MKNILGKILIFTLLQVCSFADANLATYSLSANKTTTHLKEAVEITFQARQKDHTNVMFFFLEPKESKDYKIELLQKNEEEFSYHDKKTTFTYLLFALKDGDITIDFNFTIKLASDEAVAQIYRGGRNNEKWIDTNDKNIPLAPIVLHVKEIQKDTELVGDFKISSKLKSDHIHPYENANLTYTLEGEGYNETDINFIDMIKDVTIFKDLTEDFNKATKDGYQMKREYSYALVGEKDFSIHSKEIKCYSPKQDRYYTLQTQPYNIKVDEIADSTLVDNEDYPEEDYNFDKIKSFFIYLTLFVAGFMSAKLLPKSFQIKRKEQKYDDIRDAKTPNELLLLLLDRYRTHQLKESVNDLESLLYKNSNKKSFATIKKEILEALE